MRITAAISGDLTKIMLRERKDAAIAVTKGITEASVGLKNDLRKKIASAGLGKRLPKTWQHKIFPKGRQKSTGAAGLVFSKAPGLMVTLNRDNLIKASRKRFLAIPTENAPKIKVKGGALRPIPANEWKSSGAERSLGPLHLISRRGKPALLVANLQARKNKGGFTLSFESEKKRAGGKRRVTVIMYVLVKTVRLPRRINIDSLPGKWADQIDELILKNYPETKQGPFQFAKDVL